MHSPCRTWCRVPLGQNVTESRNTWRLLIDGDLAGALNMARDVAILESVADGRSRPTLRLYGWRPPCLTLGRHQGLDTVDPTFCRDHGIQHHDKTGSTCFGCRPDRHEQLLSFKRFGDIVVEPEAAIEPVESLPDSDELAVELWVRGVDAPLIEAGRKVRLQFEGWPAVQFSGWPSVAVGTFGGIVASEEPVDRPFLSDEGRVPHGPTTAEFSMAHGLRAAPGVEVRE